MGVFLIPTYLGSITPYIQYPKQSRFFFNEGLVVTPGGDDCILGHFKKPSFLDSRYLG